MNIYVGNLDPQVDEELLYELFVQVAPVRSVHLPRDKVSRQGLGYGFVEFGSERDANYALLVMQGVKLFGKLLRLNPAGSSSSSSAVAALAELFIGNLDQLADEALLSSMLSSFGECKVEVVRGPDGVSKGHAFATFEEFATADKVIEALNGQFILNRPCKVEYAVRDGRRRGQAAERLLQQMQRINTKK